MLLINILFQIVCFQQTFVCSLHISPRSPVPHAKLLDQLLTFAHLNNNTEPNSLSVFDYLFGNNITESENLEMSEHLDISVLSPENVDKILERAKRKYLLEERAFNATYNASSRRHWDYIYYKNDFYISKVMSWMQQSIYGTRRRLEVSRPFRKKFHKDISYNIGVLFGIIKEMMIKVESVLTSMWRIDFRHQFIWFIFSYQRLLSFNIDITYIVERMFEFQKQWNALLGRKEKGASEEDTTPGDQEESALDALASDSSFLANIAEGMGFGNMGAGENMQGMPGGPGDAPGGAPGPPRGDNRDYEMGPGYGGPPGARPGQDKHNSGGPNDPFVAYEAGPNFGPPGGNGPHGGGPPGDNSPHGAYGPHGGGPPGGNGPHGAYGPHGGGPPEGPSPH